MQTYQSFARDESGSLQSLTDLKSDVVILSSNDRRFDVYPSNEEALKEIKEHRNSVKMYRLNRQMTTLACFKVTPNLTATEEAWSFNFESMNETVMTFKESRAENGLRDSEAIISGKTFKRFEGAHSLLAVLTLAKITQSFKLHLIDPATGAIIVTKQITDKIPAKVPLLVAYDNAIIVGLHQDKDKMDDLILTEIFIAPEMAQSEYKGDAKKASLADLAYTVTTNIALNWKIFGLQMIRAAGTEYIVSIDEENNLRSLEVGKLPKGQPEKATEANSKKVKFPDGLRFRAPAMIEYNHEKKTMLVHGVDIYSFQFP